MISDAKKPSHADHKSSQQDEWDTKEATGREHCMYCGMAKGTS